MRTSEEFDRIGRNKYSAPHFDYRFVAYPLMNRLLLTEMLVIPIIPSLSGNHILVTVA